MERKLADMSVAALVNDYFEWEELIKPKEALEKEGASVKIISTNFGKIKGLNRMENVENIEVDLTFEEADPQDFDAVLIPGGVANVDSLRNDKKAQEFVQIMDEADMPFAIICHGSWLLVSANLVNGRIITSYHSLKDDIRNAGGRWVDFEVVVNDNWVTSRNIKDIPAFIDAMILLFANYPGECDLTNEEPEV